MTWLMARMIALFVFGIFCNSIKTNALYNSFSASACCCGCIDRFWSGSLDFLDLHAPEELPLGNLEEPNENIGFGRLNFRPYHWVEGKTVGLGAASYVVV